MKDILNKFCCNYGYTGNIHYDYLGEELSVFISKSNNNAVLSLTKDEYESVSYKDFEKLLLFLHGEFIKRFA